jgi:hypothetical protein
MNFTTTSEPLRIAAWLRANAKHMGNPYEIDLMLRAAVVMEQMFNELQKYQAPRNPS